MTSPVQQPGWYPAPDGSAASWWWDGTQWVQPTVEAPKGKPVGRLSLIVRTLLYTTVGFTIAGIAVDMYGLSVISAVIDGDSGAIASSSLYDAAVLAVTSLLGLCGLATAVFWLIWQHRLATMALGRTRRGPGWHVWGWIIPVVSFWFPYQDISDLWRAAGRERPRWQVQWWMCWILAAVSGGIANLMTNNAASLEGLRTAVYLQLVSSFLTLGATQLAVRLVRELSRAYEAPQVLQASQAPQVLQAPQAPQVLQAPQTPHAPQAPQA